MYMRSTKAATSGNGYAKERRNQVMVDCATVACLFYNNNDRDENEADGARRTL